MKVNLSWDQLVEAVSQYSERLYPEHRCTFVHFDASEDLHKKPTLSAVVTMRESQGTVNSTGSPGPAGRPALERLAEVD